MTNKEVDDFRSTNCKKMYYTKEMKRFLSQVAKMFPNVKFSGDKCNPCDSDCKFSISTTTEQLSVEEDLKPKPSKQFRTSKETVNKGADPDLQKLEPEK